MADELTFVERATLFALMAVAREIPNVELAQQYRIELKAASREKLRRRGLIDVREEKRRIYLTLSDLGWKQWIDEFDAEVPAGSGAMGGALYAVAGSVKRYLDRSDLSHQDFFQAPTADARMSVAAVTARIRTAYATLARRPGGWVKLADLRRALGTVDRDTVDRALVDLIDKPGVAIVPESNQKSLTAADREAAVTIGNQLKHLIAIGV